MTAIPSEPSTENGALSTPAKGLTMRADMAALIRLDLKHATRRVVKPQPEIPEGYKPERTIVGGKIRYFLKPYVRRVPPGGERDGSIFTPRFQPGQILYIREPWAELDDGRIVYNDSPEQDRAQVTRWRNARFMPRNKSGTLVRILDVTLERIQDITPQQCLREGIRIDRELERIFENGPLTYSLGAGAIGRPPGLSAKLMERFAALWNEIHAKPIAVHVRPGLGMEKVISHYTSYPWESQPSLASSGRGPVNEVNRGEGAPSEPTFYRGRPHYIYGNPWVLAYAFEVVRP